jgi:hypothetical protein
MPQGRSPGDDQSGRPAPQEAWRRIRTGPWAGRVRVRPDHVRTWSEGVGARRDHDGGSTDVGVWRKTCCAVAAVVQELGTPNMWVAAEVSAALQTPA